MGNNKDRQVAAICVARLFQGMGTKVVKIGAGMGYDMNSGQTSSSFTEMEKQVLMDAFDAFLEMISGEKTDEKKKKVIAPSDLDVNYEEDDYED